MQSQFFKVLVVFVYLCKELVMIVKMFLEVIVESVITIIQLSVCTIKSKDGTNSHT
jgi:hypothetical protein